MAAIEFDILEYMEGLTGFIFPKAVLKRIALDRGVAEVTDYAVLTKRDKDLLEADLLLTAYLSPNIWASFNQEHGAFKKGVGSQTVYNKEDLLDYLKGIYEEYEDPMLDRLSDGQVFFRNDI